MHTVELNLPEIACCGDLPDPTKPVLVIDGKPFDSPYSIKIECGIDQMPTVVTVAFYAEIVGKVRVAGGSLVFKELHRDLSDFDDKPPEIKHTWKGCDDADVAAARAIVDGFDDVITASRSFDKRTRALVIRLADAGFTRMKAYGLLTEIGGWLDRCGVRNAVMASGLFAEINEVYASRAHTISTEPEPVGKSHADISR